MDLNMKLMKKIHDDAGEKSHIAITRDWSDEVPELKYQDKTFYDQLFKIDEFIEKSHALIDLEVEDTYFSINSFRRMQKQTSRVWHLNAFVLDFDYYKIEKYKNIPPLDMYEKYIKKELELTPTAVVDSGRGIYVIYCFKHACKGMLSTYKAIYQELYKRLEKYGMDPNAMNVTQIIRLPGTFNSKAFKPVQVLKFEDTEYRLGDFFNLFKYAREEVQAFKKRISDRKEKVKTWSTEELEKRYKFRDEQSKAVIYDLKKLIEIRNERGCTEGFREVLIYIARRRMRFKGCDLNEELALAHELNGQFKVPLSAKEVERNCTPYGCTKCCSINTIIKKLNISIHEQMQLNILKKKSMKDSERLRRKRLHKLLNLTNKQKIILERRTKVAKLKDEGKRNYEIAQLLVIDKSTVTRDLQYIKQYGWKFVKKLKEAMKELSCSLNDIYLVRKCTYTETNSLTEWLKISEKMLE